MDLLFAIEKVTAVLRSVLLAGGVVMGVVAVTDWAVRTRRINPFNGVARFIRSNVDPRLAGVERQVVRTGGNPSATPWWALAAYAIAAALVLAALGMVVDLLREVAIATSYGASGILFLLIRWSFAFLRIALLVRVFSFWFPGLAMRPWLRWSFGSTEWMLRPLRNVVPTLGMIDITPIIAYFGLGIAQWLISTLIPGVG